jgi:ssDNA-binding Zn-finger/Zn-ribbon topoisomerase 1
MTQNELEAEVVEDDRAIGCPKCNETVKPEFSRSGKHIKATCPNCNRYLKFVRQIAFLNKPWWQLDD